MIFRAFWGEPCPEARELEEGHLHHPEAPFNPANGEIEDNDVGFPGPEHHIAERAVPDEGRDGRPRRAGRHRRRWCRSRGSTPRSRSSSTRRSPTRPCTSTPATALTAFGLVLGTVLGLAGIFIAYRVWVVHPGTSERVRERFAFLYRLFVNKWYFDELIDLVVVRPWAWVGRFGQQTFERVVVNGFFVGGTTGIVKAGSAAARALQNGFLRAYAALLVLGLVAVAFYFLIQSS